MAGTDANVYVNVFGERGDTGIRALRKSQNMNKFEKGKVCIFLLHLGLLLIVTSYYKIPYKNENQDILWLRGKALLTSSHLPLTTVGLKLKYLYEKICIFT